MWSWISANLPTILVGAAVLFVLAAVVVKLVKDKKSHRDSCACGCSCEGCPSAMLCHKK